MAQERKKIKKTLAGKKSAKKTKKPVKKTLKKPLKKKRILPIRSKKAAKKISRRKKTTRRPAARMNIEVKAATPQAETVRITAKKPTHKIIPVKLEKTARSPFVVDLYYEDERPPRLERMDLTSPESALTVEQTFAELRDGGPNAGLNITDSEINIEELMDDFKKEDATPVGELALFGVAEIAGLVLCKLERGLNWPFSFLRPAADRFREDFIETPLEHLAAPIIFEPPQGWMRAIVSLAGLVLVVVLPFEGYAYYKNVRDTKDTIERYGRDAVAELSAAAKGGEDLTRALFSIEQANRSFREAGQELSRVNRLLIEIAELTPSAGKKVQTGEALIAMGDNLTAAAVLLAKGAQGLLAEDSINLVTKLDAMLAYVRQAEPLITLAEEQARAVDLGALPEEYQKNFSLAYGNLTLIQQSLNDFINLGETMELFLGKEQNQRYLFIFENNTEIRPTGGFMGSFALIDMDRGEIKNIEVPGGGTYDMQGSLDTDVIPPEPLRLIADRWEFQDANWFADFPTSAKKIIWFYEHSGGPTPDGVVVITATVMERLLEIYGPIEMPAYGRTFTAENFIEETQKIVELEYDKTENKPKKVIGDLAPILLDRMMHANREQFIETLEALGSSLTERQIMIYHQNAAIERGLSEHGWTGEIKKADQDYLMLVNANIAGGKTDGVISQNVDLKTEISENGDIVNTLTVARAHDGIKNQGFSGVNNVNYLRVYVPQGAELLNASGFNPPAPELFDEPRKGAGVDSDLAEIEGTWSFHNSGAKINNEFGKTVFGGWTQTKPGESTLITFKYRLPFRISSAEPTGLLATAKEKLGFPITQTYSMLLQRQPGAEKIDFSQSIIYPARYQALWSNVPELMMGKLEQKLTTDAFFAILLEKKF
ncbi:MAG: DUF4012 domain-containing protein [Patescibacteria group bacterium]|nr:DUF4012 domain-containing protein [Patescibacteria group bacterium]